eukprot:TRINITY_DN20641_c0_g1_i1.p1 TRINITY_DN20641_c0_g1~~TRINITY_DN20641_c0_g1_i1.p1  ORF type:complete len:358 (+),score=35.51 TRINITY_DN20641_c0_g1_i1:34-1107(+)
MSTPFPLTLRDGFVDASRRREREPFWRASPKTRTDAPPPSSVSSITMSAELLASMGQGSYRGVSAGSIPHHSESLYESSYKDTQHRWDSEPEKYSSTSPTSVSEKASMRSMMKILKEQATDVQQAAAEEKYITYRVMEKYSEVVNGNVQLVLEHSERVSDIWVASTAGLAERKWRAAGLPPPRRPSDDISAGSLYSPSVTSKVRNPPSTPRQGLLLSPRPCPGSISPPHNSPPTTPKHASQNDLRGVPTPPPSKSAAKSYYTSAPPVSSLPSPQPQYEPRSTQPQDQTQTQAQVRACDRATRTQTQPQPQRPSNVGDALQQVYMMEQQLSTLRSALSHQLPLNYPQTKAMSPPTVPR